MKGKKQNFCFQPKKLYIKINFYQHALEEKNNKIKINKITNIKRNIMKNETFYGIHSKVLLKPQDEIINFLSFFIKKQK